jgi:hypothetical protein
MSESQLENIDVATHEQSNDASTNEQPVTMAVESSTTTHNDSNTVVSPGNAPPPTTTPQMEAQKRREDEIKEMLRPISGSAERYAVISRNPLNHSFFHIFCSVKLGDLPWRKIRTVGGFVFYYNVDTRQSIWKMPPEVGRRRQRSKQKRAPLTIHRSLHPRRCLPTLRKLCWIDVKSWKQRWQPMKRHADERTKSCDVRLWNNCKNNNGMRKR